MVSGVSSSRGERPQVRVGGVAVRVRISALHRVISN